MNCVVIGQTYFHQMQCVQLVNCEVPYVKKNEFPLETVEVLSWTCMPEERGMERGSSQQLLERSHRSDEHWNYFKGNLVEAA